MIPYHRVLAQRIREEISEIDRTYAAIQRHWQQALTVTNDRDAYVNSVALNLHSFYSGLERIFELIAIELDGVKLGGADWHSELLRQMTLDLEEVRPPVLRKETAAHLDEYRKFRHRIRNIYATNLDPDRMEALIRELPELWTQIQEELASFRAFLDKLARADEM